jgi:small subunit ribosomal protein S15Ae
VPCLAEKMFVVVMFRARLNVSELFALLRFFFFFSFFSDGCGSRRMVRVSVLNDCLRAIVNAERLGKRQVIVRPSSKVIIKFLQVMMQKGYIGEFEIVDDHRGNKIVIELHGRINKCGVVTPRFDVALPDLERWIGTLLPSRQFGFLVLTTSKGIMDHEQVFALRCRFLLLLLCF